MALSFSWENLGWYGYIWTMLNTSVAINRISSNPRSRLPWRQERHGAVKIDNPKHLFIRCFKEMAHSSKDGLLTVMDNQYAKAVCLCQGDTTHASHWQEKSRLGTPETFPWTQVTNILRNHVFFFLRKCRRRGNRHTFFIREYYGDTPL